MFLGAFYFLSLLKITCPIRYSQTSSLNQLLDIDTALLQCGNNSSGFPDKFTQDKNPQPALIFDIPYTLLERNKGEKNFKDYNNLTIFRVSLKSRY